MALNIKIKSNITISTIDSLNFIGAMKYLLSLKEVLQIHNTTKEVNLGYLTGEYKVIPKTGIM